MFLELSSSIEFPFLWLSVVDQDCCTCQRNVEFHSECCPFAHKVQQIFFDIGPTQILMGFCQFFFPVPNKVYSAQPIFSFLNSTPFSFHYQHCWIHLQLPPFDNGQVLLHF